MLDEWEEPEQQERSTKDVKITDVLHFRRALEYIDPVYPFSAAFGKAGTREQCVQSAQSMFDKLMTGRRYAINFRVLCQIAEKRDGTHDKAKVRDLMRMFRPNRLGEITKLDFVKSVDSVYKDLRLTLANINNSSQIDRAYQRIINTIFYTAVTFIVLAIYGLDVNAIFILLSSIIVSFAFMIGSAASKYLEGILLILVRKPYDIGDRVCFLDANADVDDFGPPSGGWVVENVDLYTTTVRLGTTREYSTFANGSLASSRILNLKRSDKPNVYMYLKFTTNVTQEQLDSFRSEMTEYIRDRPREWIKLVSFRCSRVETELQYLEYVLIVQHREAWQSFSTIQVSKGDVYIHALHLQRKLRMNYTAPKLPVELLTLPSNAMLSLPNVAASGNNPNDNTLPSEGENKNKYL